MTYLNEILYYSRHDDGCVYGTHKVRAILNFIEPNLQIVIFVIFPKFLILNEENISIWEYACKNSIKILYRTLVALRLNTYNTEKSYWKK